MKFSKAPQNPWSIQITCTYGCNRSCEFCGIHSIDKDGKYFIHIPVELVKSLAIQLNQSWKGRRIELNTNGDPSLHPRIFDIVSTINTYYPSGQIQLQTNGLKWKSNMHKYLNEFYKAGGDILVIDSYDGMYKEFNKLCKSYAKLKSNIKYVDYNHNNPDNFSYWKNYGRKVKALVLTDDLDNASDIQPKNRCITNHAGAVNPEYMKKMYKECGKDYLKSFPIVKPCTRVYREIVVNVFGGIQVCCYNWVNNFIYGNIYKNHIYDIWNSRVWNLVRQLMKNKDRSGFRPCNTCDYSGGYRIGLCRDTVLKKFVKENRSEVLDELKSHMKKYKKGIHWTDYAEVNGCKIKSGMVKPTSKNSEAKVLSKETVNSKYINK